MSSGSASDISTAPPPAAASGGGKLRVFVRRLSSTLALWGLLTVAIIFHTPWPYFLLIAVLGLGSLWEFLQMDRGIPARFRGWSFGVVVAYYLIMFGLVLRSPGGYLELGWLDLAAFICALTGPFYLTLTRPLDGRQTLWNLIYPAFGFVYVAYFFSFIVRIIFSRWPGSPDLADSGIYYALFIIAATKFTDSGAYAFGSLWGKHKMIPHISPGKTWEGLSGAFAGSYIAGMTAKWATADKTPLLTYPAALVLCFFIAVICVVGDLAESVLKRCLGVKDSGRTLPGIGGALDLIDSLLFTMPVMYFYLRYVS